VLSQDRAAYGDSVLTNADSQDVPGAESVPNSSSASHNNKQCKRERERARYAAMSQEEKNARNLRKREARQKKEYQSPMEINGSQDRASFGDLTNCTNGGAEGESRLQIANNSTEQRKRERERTRYATMSQEEKNARNLRKREARQKKKRCCMHFVFAVLHKYITCNLDVSIFQDCYKLVGSFNTSYHLLMYIYFGFVLVWSS